ncbi:MAG: polysaccharide lyase [Hyphomicrobium sp.]
MFKMSGISMVFNVAGVAAVVIVGGYFARSVMTRQQTASCLERYPAATELSLAGEKGRPMSAIELQGRFGRNEWGVIENVSVVRSSERERGSEVLNVKLPAGSSSAFQSRAPKGGAGFLWSPESLTETELAGATGACLSYRVFFPDDFEFAEAGLLPGLFGGESVDPAGSNGGRDGFSTRLTWGSNGTAGVVNVVPADANKERFFGDTGFRIERGRWVHFATELVLNSPGSKDGIQRLWVDGDLKMERHGLIWRNDEQVAVSGVAADISYGNIDNWAVAPKDAEIRLSPFALSWQ